MSSTHEKSVPSTARALPLLCGVLSLRCLMGFASCGSGSRQQVQASVQTGGGGSRQDVSSC